LKENWICWSSLLTEEIGLEPKKTRPHLIGADREAHRKDVLHLAVFPSGED
jgi:hypothetical protein